MQVNEGFWGQFGAAGHPDPRALPAPLRPGLTPCAPPWVAQATSTTFFTHFWQICIPTDMFGRYQALGRAARTSGPRTRTFVRPSQGARPTREGTLWVAQENQYVNDVRIGCPPAPRPHSSA